MSKMLVVCIQAAIGYERLNATRGTLVATPLPRLGYLFCPESEPVSVTIEDLRGWEFRADEDVPSAARVNQEAEAPQRRARDQYDATRFATDLDAAIARIRERVLARRREAPADPQLQSDLPPGEALARVCEALALRTFDYDSIIGRVLRDTRQLLISKNQQYGNSALDPVRVFSKAPLHEQLLVRLDDKVSRLARGSAAGEDVASDILGYLVLVEMAAMRETP